MPEPFVVINEQQVGTYDVKCLFPGCPEIVTCPVVGYQKLRATPETSEVITEVDLTPAIQHHHTHTPPSTTQQEENTHG